MSELHHLLNSVQPQKGLYVGIIHLKLSFRLPRFVLISSNNPPKIFFQIVIKCLGRTPVQLYSLCKQVIL